MKVSVYLNNGKKRKGKGAMSSSNSQILLLASIEDQGSGEHTEALAVQIEQECVVSKGDSRA